MWETGLRVLCRIDELIGKIKNAEDELLATAIKVKELEAANRQLEKEELDAKTGAEFNKNVSSRVFGF